MICSSSSSFASKTVRKIGKMPSINLSPSFLVKSDTALAPVNFLSSSSSSSSLSSSELSVVVFNDDKIVP